MSAIGFSQKYFISSHADYRREDYLFARTQSAVLRSLEWERTKPLQSWTGLVAPWVAAGLVAMLVIGWIF